MLVLSRKKMTSIVIDERITVTVVAIRGGVVRLGIEAPSEVCIRRNELPKMTKAGRQEYPSYSRQEDELETFATVAM